MTTHTSAMSDRIPRSAMNPTALGMITFATAAIQISPEKINKFRFSSKQPPVRVEVKFLAILRKDEGQAVRETINVEKPWQSEPPPVLPSNWI